MAADEASPVWDPDWARRLIRDLPSPHPPDDFVDEETVVEDRPREAVLRLVK